MIKTKAFVILFLVLFCSVPPAQAQRGLDSEELFSPSNARIFHKIAYELYTSSDIGPSEIEQAMVFLRAAINLDPKADYIFVDLLNLGSKFTNLDHVPIVRWGLENYVDENADLEVTSRAIKYLLERLDSRELRENMLGGLLYAMGEKNDMLGSELATQLALLAAEKADFENARRQLMRAYNANPHNKLAFAKLKELFEQLDREMPPAICAKHFRLAMGASPLDIDATLAFARYTEKLELYDLSAAAYRYTAELFKYLYPDNDLPPSIYLPWAITNYNTRRGLDKCLQIAVGVRQDGHFDIVLEGIAASAARKMGRTNKAEEILQSIRKEEKKVTTNETSEQALAGRLAWFYCFAAPDNAKALAWANGAYSEQPDLPPAKAILAHALALNNQMKSAVELAADLQKTNQIAALTMAITQLAAGENGPALVTLKAAIAMDPASLAAERAKTLLKQNGSEYIVKTPPEAILTELINSFGERIVPRFSTPDKIISARLNITGSEFSYGKDFDATVVLTNESSDALLISRNGLFTGNIRVDADVRGDITAKIPALISKRIRPSAPIEAGQYLAIPLDLMTGSLRWILFTYPQASLEIEFTVYLDPVVDKQGKVRNAVWDIEPAKAVIKRQGIALTRSYLMQSLDALDRGMEGQKRRVSQLFCGLLMEQYAMAESGPLYQYAEMGQTFLTSAVTRSLRDEEWKIKVHTMAAMLLFPTPLDYELTRTVSENIYDDYWPVRMMTLYLLSKKKGQGEQFKQVLDWTAKYDSHPLVRTMVIALGAEKPEAPEMEPPQNQQGTPRQRQNR